MTPETLATALTEAVREAGVCARWCRIGSEPVESGFHVWHNAAGPSQSSEQRVYNEKVLALSESALTALLVRWIVAMHKRGPYVDLNAEHAS